MIVPKKIILITSDIYEDSRAVALENYINGKVFGYHVITVKESELKNNTNKLKNKIVIYGIKHNVNFANCFYNFENLKVKSNSKVKPTTKNVGKLRKINNLVNRFNATALFCLNTSSLYSCIKARQKFGFKAMIIAYLDSFTFDSKNTLLGADKYIVENDKFKEDLATAGVNREDIFVKRFPINKNNVVTESIEECKQMFDLQDKTVLLYGGNLGNSKVADIFKLLIEIKNKYSLAVYLGENERLFEKLQKIKKDNNLDTVKIFTTINNVEKLFMASDVIVSIYDINAIYLAKLYSKSIILYSPSNDAENNDLSYLAKANEVIYSKDNSDIIVKIFDVLNNDKKIAYTDELKTSTAEVANYIIDLLGE